MFNRSTITATALLTLAAAPALAQQPRQGNMGGMMGPMMQQQGMMMGMHAQPGPEMLLRASEELGLTDQQVERLTELRDRTVEEHRALMQPAMNAGQRASSALEGDSPDLEAYARAVNEAADGMAEAHVAMARAAVEAKAVLTDEQRQQLDTALSLMRSMGGGMMHGGMMPGGGMGGMHGGMMHGGSTGGGSGAGGQH